MDAKIKRMPSPCRECDERTADCRGECIAWKIYEATLEVWRKEHDEEYWKKSRVKEYFSDQSDKITKLRYVKERRR